MSNVVESMFTVWTSISEWMIATLESLTPVFYNAESGLTFLGTLGVAGLGVSVILLVLSIVQGFLHFRG